MSMTRVRVRRDRPTALAWSIALAVTMLVVYLATLNAGRPDVVESVSAAPRVTREIEFEKLEGWCVSMARCDSPESARIQASATTARGAAGDVALLDGAWHVLGAVYASEKDAERVAGRLKKDAGIDAQVLRLAADGLRLRITAPQRQIDAIAGADALLRAQAKQLGEVALQVDRGEIGADAARTLCAVAASEAAEARAALDALPGAAENGLCAALIARLDALAAMQDAVAKDGRTTGAALSGMLRCAQVETFLGHRAMLGELGAG